MMKDIMDSLYSRVMGDRLSPKIYKKRLLFGCYQAPREMINYMDGSVDITQLVGYLPRTHMALG